MSFFRYALTSIALLFSFLVQAQEQKTLAEQFDELVNNSNSYQDFKVVKKAGLDDLKNSVVDSISVYQTALAQMQSEIDSQKIETDLIQKELQQTQLHLTNAQAKEDGILFLGILLSKSTYNAIVWSIIALLIILLFVFISKFNNSNKTTTFTKEKLAELESEFEQHRQRALEREQQLNRKLLDEVNKNKSSQ